MHDTNKELLEVVELIGDYGQKKMVSEGPPHVSVDFFMKYQKSFYKDEREQGKRTTMWTKKKGPWSPTVTNKFKYKGKEVKSKHLCYYCGKGDHFWRECAKAKVSKLEGYLDKLNALIEESFV